MTKTMVIFCACSSEEEGGNIAEALVGERLAACVSILPGALSVYRWQGKVERAREVLLQIKTTDEMFETLCRRLRDLHSYDTPEILALAVVKGSEDYIDWVRQQVGPER